MRQEEFRRHLMELHRDDLNIDVRHVDAVPGLDSSSVVVHVSEVLLDSPIESIQSYLP